VVSLGGEATVVDAAVGIEVEESVEGATVALDLLVGTLTESSEPEVAVGSVGSAVEV